MLMCKGQIGALRVRFGGYFEHKFQEGSPNLDVMGERIASEKLAQESVESTERTFLVRFSRVPKDCVRPP